MTIVTGANRGLGLDTTKWLVSEGHSVLAIARKASRGSELSKLCAAGMVTVLEGDLGDDALPETLNEFILSGNVRIRRVLHCAGGGLGIREPLLSRREFYTLLEANLLGAVALNGVVIPHMIAEGQGRIIHVGSTAATHAVGSVGYNTVKAGLAAYVRSLGRAMIGQHIIVAGINPGAFTATDNAMVRLRDQKPDVFAQFVEQRLPRGVMAQASELFGVLRFLLFGDAEMLAGSMVAADAGEGLAY